jgi:hypothetical protein
LVLQRSCQFCQQRAIAFLHRSSLCAAVPTFNVTTAKRLAHTARRAKPDPDIVLAALNKRAARLVKQ